MVTSRTVGIAKRVLGPAMGPSPYPSADESDDDIGPTPLPAWHVPEKRDAVREFMEKEERRRKALEVRRLTLAGAHHALKLWL
jgi:hypothetical protein